MDAESIQTGSPWHAGELALQTQAGVVEKMSSVGRRVIRDYLPEQHRAFYAQLPFIAVGAVARDGDVWATFACGRPGFIASPSTKHLHLAARFDPHDPAASGIAEGAAIGLLGIELHTRRRNRMNGTIRHATPDGLDIEVGQSFGNCPQYIQLRDFDFAREPQTFSAIAPEASNALDERARTLIAHADTFFVASYADEAARRQVDVSHRGGKTGFVRINADGTLTVPEFAGNLFFATLGNFLLNPRAGLAFVDFRTGDVLQMTGDARVDLESAEIAAFQGAERLWHFTPRRVIWRAEALPLRWSFQTEGWSPNALMTGSWDEAQSRLKAAALANAWRPFRIARIVDESTQIRSFHLEPADGAGFIAHAAGQHLPIRVTLPGNDQPVLRHYTLSTAPSDRFYRISVKREGAVSSYLHTLAVGGTIEARAPAGQFTLDALAKRPAVLLAAGVGITPMLAMLRHIVYEGLRKRAVRPTWLLQSARTLRERAFADEIAQLQQAANGAVRVVRVLSDTSAAAESQDYESTGRIDLALLRNTLPFDDYDFYLCGPAGFMQSIYDGLRDLNIADERIHAEAFGPSGLERRRDPATASSPPPRVAASAPVPVVFTKTAKEARWHPQSGTLLELAEARGLTPEFGCRSGGCGSCRTRIVAGAVAYPTPPAFAVPENEALICCAVPAQAEAGGEGGGRLMLDL
ncbi:2Fe-2S iron-sulfur cluster-binding protein [Paraburkholderia acidisoli]|uniref:2Fe-2S iron-sulfur cluster binding domain-containing protein n=1 Tax=Paraburkholderia acidisoli TaxID=2571748 RepID=A0A7Z2JI64_9BURK|nr:pyridoxamine 5'-phosphate oxidase family protein [Paraburkholderia acidisoli]QGZ64868.1 2Fe-2S iron-sulfur cluster binding domain-containing protein [Paraburkholderia acidisoli]